MTTTTQPASSSRTHAQEPAPTPAEVPAPTAPTADLPRNLAPLTTRAESAGWTATVQTQPGHCALVLTARQEAGETVLRCVAAHRPGPPLGRRHPAPLRPAGRRGHRMARHRRPGSRRGPHRPHTADPPGPVNVGVRQAERIARDGGGRLGIHRHHPGG